MLGSELAARVLGRVPILLYVGEVVLVLTATRMILHDEMVQQYCHPTISEMAILAGLLSVAIIWLGLRVGNSLPPPPPAEQNLKSPGKAPGHVLDQLVFQGFADRDGPIAGVELL